MLPRGSPQVYMGGGFDRARTGGEQHQHSHDHHHYHQNIAIIIILRVIIILRAIIITARFTLTIMLAVVQVMRKQRPQIPTLLFWRKNSNCDSLLS